MTWPPWLLAFFRPKPPPPPPPPAVHVGGGDLVEQLNATRARLGVSPAAGAVPEHEAARVQADWQARRDLIGHDGPPGGVTLSDRLRTAGAVFSAAGEIVAETNSADFQQAIALWLNSPAHRKILLDPSWTEAGAATSSSASGRVYHSAVFTR